MAGSIWKGSISFGLLNIPVSLQKAQEGKELHFSMLDERDLSPIKYKKVNARDGKEVPYEKIVKGYEYESGEFVLMSKDDFKAANPKATQTIDIQDFVAFDDIDLMFMEKPYYLVPQKSGVKGYFLLAEALKKTKKVAIAKIIIRTKEHLAAVMEKDGYLIIELLRFAHEVLETHEVEYLNEIDKPRFSAKELKMAQDLIEGMSSDWDPEQYKDTYTDDIMKIVEMKIKAGKSKAIDYGDIFADEEEDDSNVVDLMPLLKQSLEQKKKERGSSSGHSHKKASSKKAKKQSTSKHHKAG